jgi:hypothetical protein
VNEIKDEAEARAENQRAEGISEGNGIYLTFESAPNFPLKFESLDMAGAGIELLTVKTLADNRMQATLWVPDGKLGRFLKKIEAYRDKNTKPKKGREPRPSNQDLVESVDEIKLAAIEALWTETTLPFPDKDAVTTWEVWLRRTKGELNHLERLRAHGEAFNLTIGRQTLGFVDRTVVIVTATARSLSRSADILGMIAELRLPKTSAAFFADLNGIEQQDWVNNLVARVQAPPATTPYVCLFDTGLNHAHPLLTSVVNQADLHTYKPAWGLDDRKNHGTPMAGLAAFGDLTEALASGDPIITTHRLESVKMIHDPDPHDPELYGAVTQESTYRVEVAPDRSRIFCMAVTATDGRERGKPTSWSAAVDALASGADDGQRRLFVLAAGNTDEAQRGNYPDSNMTDGIHDPAQAWNGLTVGGYTEKSTIDTGRYPGWSPLAPHGDLSPCSCTSTGWSRWPFKPDIVMEAGNMAINPAHAEPDYIDDGLSLLSTSANPLGTRPLSIMRETSAASALAARYCGMVWAKYPQLTPESIRALIVHCAEWTPALLARFTDAHGVVDYKNLLRYCGHGVPNLDRLLSSLDNSLTLLAESEIEPFFKDEEEDNPRVKTREMLLHRLPWPKQALTDLPNIDVTMRVTLSYFIEPSPGERGWTPRYGYQSHGLRFHVINPLETPDAFQLRINKFEREDYVPANLPDPGWTLGRNLRSTGSIHSDTWTGKAVDLASREYIAIHPTMGWWNKREQLEGWKKSTRYSLIVTIATPEQAVDLYTPVANEIGVPIVIEV